MPYTRGKSQKIRVAGCAFNTVAAIPAYLSCKGIQIIEVWVCSCKTCLRNCWSNPFCENFRRYTNIKYDKYAYASPRIAWRPTGWHSFEMWQWQHQYFLKEPAKIFHPKVCLEMMGLRCLKHSMVDIGSWISEIIKKSSMLLGYNPYLQIHSLRWNHDPEITRPGVEKQQFAWTRSDVHQIKQPRLQLARQRMECPYVLQPIRGRHVVVARLVAFATKRRRCRALIALCTLTAF